MGVRIAFYETTDGKSLLENFNRTFSEFKDWILEENKKPINDYKERIISKEIQSFLEQSGDNINVKNTSQELLDELTNEYLLTFCDYGKGKLNIKLIGPLISRHKYDTSFNIIKETNDKKLIEFWNFLKVGRSLKDDKEFTKMESDLIGFWKKNEMDYIRQKIKSIDVDDIGIECISDVLAEIDEKTELIFNIEL